MHIANPFYDTVFKYLMEDSKAAMLLLGKIIGKKIISIKPRPQEISIPGDAPSKHAVYRMDFSAVVKTHSGKACIIVEVQKARESSDILRFRRYLGKQYANPDNVEKTKNGHKGIPIINIYFLGEKLEDIDGPVVKIARSYMDVTTKKVYNVKNDFIESLTHDSYVIQGARLKQKRRNELEAVLSVFDPTNKTDDKHILNIDEAAFPEKYRQIVRRLREAAECDIIRETMFVEDEIIDKLVKAEQLAEKKNEEITKLIVKLKEKDKAIEEKDGILRRMIETMLESGVSIKEISIKFNVDEKMVAAIAFPTKLNVSESSAKYHSAKQPQKSRQSFQKRPKKAL